MTTTNTPTSTRDLPRAGQVHPALADMHGNAPLVRPGQMRVVGTGVHVGAVTTVKAAQDQDKGAAHHG